MAAFDYVAIDTGGKQRKGTLEGDSARQVRAQLREKGMTPLSVDETVQKGSKSRSKGGKDSSASSMEAKTSNYRISTLDLAIITRQMATLIQAGLPVEEALRAIARQVENAKSQAMMLAIRSRVVEGFSLAKSLEAYPRTFSELFRATVAAGERSGHLDLVLEQLAEYTETSHETARKVKGAMIYPIVLICFSVLIVTGLVMFIVPKMASTLQSSGQELPLLTAGLIGLSEFLASYWWLLIGAIGLLVFMYRKLLERPKMRYLRDKWMLSLPLVGRFVRLVNSARVASTLSILSRSGVPLVEALGISAQVTTNMPIRDAVTAATDALREGASLNRSLEKSGYFPPMMIQMIASGESSGELDTMLGRAARAQEREMDNMITTIIGLFEPLMMVFMGVVVLVIVLAIMMPIFKMQEMVG